MRQRIKLTEGDLHRMIKESVKQVLSELDWKTYDSAMRKAAQRGEWERAGDFGEASKRAFNRDFGTNNNVYDYNYRRMSVPFENDYDYYNDEYKPHTTYSNKGCYNDTVCAHSDSHIPDSLEVIPYRDTYHHRDMRGNYKTDYKDFDTVDNDVYDNEGNVWDENTTLAQAVQANRRGAKDTRDYLTGKYKYQKGKGWVK